MTSVISGFHVIARIPREDVVGLSIPTERTRCRHWWIEWSHDSLSEFVQGTLVDAGGQPVVIQNYAMSLWYGKDLAHTMEQEMLRHNARYETVGRP